MKYKHTIKCLVITLCLLLLPGLAQAAEYDSEWLGGSGGWTDASHWSTGDYPHNNGDSYNVYILDTASNPTVTLNTDITVNLLENYEYFRVVGHTFGLATAPGLSNTGTLFLQNGIVNGNVTNNNDLRVHGYSSGASYWSYLSGGLVNDGTIQLQSYGRFSYDGTAITGAGAVNVPSASTFKLVNDTNLGDNTDWGNVPVRQWIYRHWNWAGKWIWYCSGGIRRAGSSHREYVLWD